MVEANLEQEIEQEPSMPDQKPCATPDCSKPATMQCPTCIKLILPATYFCGQECFAGFWKFHKMTHKKPSVDQNAEPAGQFTGPMRPFPKSFPGLRDVPEGLAKPDYATSGAPNQHF